MGLFDYVLSYATQTPHVKDSIRFGWRLTKYGSAVDTLANAGFALEGQRGWTVNSNGIMSNEGTRIKRYFSINDNDDDAIHFNSSNTSGKPFAPVYVDSSHFIVSRGYLDADSLRFNGTTVGTSVAYHSGLGASYWGDITTGAHTAYGLIQRSGLVSGNAFQSNSTSTTIGDSAGIMFGMQGATSIGGGIWAKNVNVTGGSRSHSLTLYSYNQALSGKVLNLTRNPDGTSTFSGAVSGTTGAFTGKVQSGGLTSAGAFGMANIVDTMTYAGVNSSIAAKNLTATAGLYHLIS